MALFAASYSRLCPFGEQQTYIPPGPHQFSPWSECLSRSYASDVYGWPLRPPLLQLQPATFPTSTAAAFLPAPTNLLSCLDAGGWLLWHLRPPVVCFPRRSLCLCREVSSPGSRPEPGLTLPPPPPAPTTGEGAAAHAVPPALLPHSGDFNFCFLIAVSTGPQNKSVRKTSAADNGEPGMVRLPGEGVRRGCDRAWPPTCSGSALP